MKKLPAIPTLVIAALAGALLTGLAGVGILFLVKAPEDRGASGKKAQLTPPGRTVVQSKPQFRPNEPVRVYPPPGQPRRPGMGNIFTAGDDLGDNWMKPAPGELKLPYYQIKIAAADLMQLERNPYSDERHPAAFFTEGVLYDRVGVRFRGEWARTWPKKSFKVFFQKDKPWAGQESLNLNSGWRDPAFVREPLAYHIYQVCGAPASRCRMARLDVNGQFGGLYVEVEQPDKEYLKRYQLKGATVYKADSKFRQSDERNLGSEAAYHSHYEKETKKSENYDDLHRFCAEMESATNVLEFFNRQVDVDRYVNYLAATVLVQNWDCPNKNHLLVYDGEGSKKWLVLPWDLDRTLGDHWNGYFTEARLPILLGTRLQPSTTGWNRMMDRFMSEPVLRRRLVDRLAELVEKEFIPEKLFPIVDRWAGEIAETAAQDRRQWGGGSGNDLAGGIAQVKRYIEQRRSYLKDELARLR